MQAQFSFYKEAQRNYLDDARATARKLLGKGNRTYITSDDIWQYCPPPNLVNSKIMGQVFRDRDFQSIGWTQSRRPTSHGRAIQMFRLRSNEEQ